MAYQQWKYFLTALEVSKSKVKALTDSALSKASFHGAQDVAFSLWQEGARKFSGATFTNMQIPSTRTPLSWRDHLRKALLLTTPHGALGCNICIWGSTDLQVVVQRSNLKAVKGMLSTMEPSQAGTSLPRPWKHVACPDITDGSSLDLRKEESHQTFWQSSHTPGSLYFPFLIQQS